MENFLSYDVVSGSVTTLKEIKNFLSYDVKIGSVI